MRIIVCNNYEEISKQAAKIVAAQINLKPSCILGLATGSTPIGLYEKLIEMNQSGELDFSDVTSFNLDEYYPIANTNPQSYHYFMDKYLFSKVNIKKENTFVPNGETDNPEKECESYDRLIAAHGGIDLQILGIGQNGHIGFNEPDASLNSNTHLTGLTESTIEANSRFFDREEDVPKKALTMGIASILKSKKIILLASGRSKHKVVSELLNDGINTSVPATMLKVHPDVTLICDKEAYSSMYLGVDIGGTSIKFGVVDNDNNVVYKDSIPTRIRRSDRMIMDSVAEKCKEIIERFPVLGIGVGTPGLIDKKTKCVSASNLPFDKSPIIDYLKEQIDLPVYLENDANCAAIGEAYVSGNADNMLMITLGTGIGGGIVIDKKIYSGARGDAGEIGHMSINSEGIPCSCGQRGCWEKYASVSALIEQVEKAAEENKDSILYKLIEENNHSIDGKTIFKAIKKGCPVAKKVFDKYISYLAVGIKNIINIFQPELIVIAGGISKQGDELLRPLTEKLDTSIPIRISTLQNDAGIIGAALLPKIG